MTRLCLALARDPRAAADISALWRATAVGDAGPPSAGSKTARRHALAKQIVAPAAPVQQRESAPAARRAAATQAVPTRIESASRLVVPTLADAEAAVAPAIGGELAAAAGGANDESALAATASMSSAAAKPSTAVVFESAHAGLFFVVNAALHLGLYGDFSRPRHSGLEISPYRFLHDIGSAVGKRRFRRDPLAAWLAAEADPDGNRRPGSPRAATPTFVVAYLRARLALSLGLTDPRRLAAALLRIAGRVRIGGERIDVFFALRDLPIAIRFAGLDRDPGWLPAAGRDLRFHFD